MWNYGTNIGDKFFKRFFQAVAQPAFWYWGGGGKTPKCTDRKNRVSYMSERLIFHVTK